MFKEIIEHVDEKWVINIKTKVLKNRNEFKK